MTPKTENDHQEAGGTRPPAPRRGTRAYRRAVLEVCARYEYDDFTDGLGWLWAQNGWHVCLDMLSEMLAGLTRTAHPDTRDSYGRIDIQKFMFRFPEELKLQMAARAARDRAERMAPHEAFREALENGERIYADYEAWIPVCQEALDAVEDADGDPTAARPALVRHVPPAEREDRFHSGVLMVHSALRHWSFPCKGTAWIEPYLRGQVPDLPASRALYESGAMEDELPQWMKEAQAADDALAADPRRQKRRRRQGLEPTCTCGQH